MSKPAEAIQEVEKTEFTLEEAAEYLSKSTRTVERLQLPHSMEWKPDKKGIMREIRIFSKTVLDKIKHPKAKKRHIPGIEKAGKSPVTQEDLRNFATLLIGGIQTEMKQLAPAQDEEKKKIANFKDKLILSFSQALSYSGLPKDELKAALDNKQIFGKKTSEKGVWKINRHSLDEFCKNYGS